MAVMWRQGGGGGGGGAHSAVGNSSDLAREGAQR